MQKTFASHPLVLFVIVACIATGAPIAAAADTIRFGAIFQATGNNAAPGQYVRDGILLAVQEINKRGGLNGSKLEIAFADSGSDPQTASDAFNRLENSLHPLMYLSYSSNVGMALAPLAEENHVVVLGLRPGEHDLTFPMYPAQILNGTLIYR
jgi:branched-chain amino acid transport system substrate-binding protein